MSIATRLVAGALLIAAVVVVDAPVLSFELMGDDYQWVQHAHAATHRPLLLLSDLDTFYRPTNTWTLAIDRVLWRSHPAGYHLTNLILQALTALTLAAVARRVGLSRLAAFAASLLWALSPFALEPAASVAIRFENLLLLAWLGLAIAWPRESESWTLRRITSVAALTTLAMLSKETWVVTPGIVLALEVSVHRVTLRRAVRTTLPFVGAVALYVLLYFLAFPSDKGYFAPSLAVLAKVPRTLAAFAGVGGWEPAPSSASLVSLVVSAAVLAVIATLRRRPAVAVGAALLFLPFLPVLFVPFMPLRYAHIPFAGFVLVAAAGVSAALGLTSGPMRRVCDAAAIVGVALLAALWTSATRATLADFERVSQAHSKLLVEARAFAPRLPGDRPVVVLRLEHGSVFEEVARFPRGWPQPWFARHDDPAALVDAAALFEWVTDDPRLVVRRIDDWATATSGLPGAVVAHGAGGFRVVEDRMDDTAAAAARWSHDGTRLRVIALTTR